MTFDEVTRTDGKQITSADIARVVDAHERMGRTVIWPPVYVPKPDGSERFIFAFRDARATTAPAAPAGPANPSGGFSW